MICANNIYCGLVGSPRAYFCFNDVNLGCLRLCHVTSYVFLRCNPLRSKVVCVFLYFIC
jgi:hypothetical protein